MLIRLVAVSIAFLTVGACATVSSFSETRFPSPERLAEIASAPVPPSQRVDPPRIVESWELLGPFPDRFSDQTPPLPSPAGSLLLQLAPTRASEALSCAARELAWFRLKNGDDDAEPLLVQFMLGRCGSVEATVASWWLTYDEMPSDDAAVLEDARARIGTAMGEIHGERVGLAVVRDGNHGIVLLAAATPRAQVEGSQVAVDGKLHFTGTLSPRGSGKKVVHADALVTTGQWGVAPCQRDLSALLPRFAFTCPIGRVDDEAGSPTATVAVMVLEEGRLLSNGAATLLALAGVGPAKRFARLAADDAKPVPPLEDLPAAFLAQTNALRASQGLAPLAAAAKQQAEAARLAPRYFATQRGRADGDDGADEIGDVIALGLLAGWQVEALIGNGDFASVLLYGERLTDLLAGALGAPIARAALMDPEAEIASLAVAPAAGGVGLLISTYQRLKRPPADAPTRAFEALRAARRARGVSDLMILPVKGAELAAAQRVQDEGAQPWDALGGALRAAVDARGNALQGWLIEAQSLDAIVWPDALLTAQPTSVAIGVASYKHPKAAWGNLAVIVVAEVDKVQVAVADLEPGDGRLGQSQLMGAVSTTMSSKYTVNDDTPGWRTMPTANSSGGALSTVCSPTSLTTLMPLMNSSASPVAPLASSRRVCTQTQVSRGNTTPVLAKLLLPMRKVGLAVRPSPARFSTTK